MQIKWGDVGYIYCVNTECDKKVKNHAWGKIKAYGWFFMKDGRAYCPNHIPDWVEAWRLGRD